MRDSYRSQTIVGRDEPPFGAFAPRGLQAAVLGLARVPPFHRVAVGEAEGRARLHIRNDDLAIAEAGLTRVDTLKADIEGFEDKALLPYLEGADEALLPGRIVIEHLGRAYWKRDCFPVFERLGYRLVGSTRGNSMFAR